MPDDKLVCVRMNLKTVKSLEKIGQELDRKLSWLIRKAADEYVERYKPAKGGEMILNEQTRANLGHTLVNEPEKFRAVTKQLQSNAREDKLNAYLAIGFLLFVIVAYIKLMF